MRSTLAVLGLVVLAAGLFLWGRGDARADAVSAPAAGPRAAGAAGAALVTSPKSEARAAAVHAEAAVPAPAPPDDLLASLRRLGEIYVAAVEAAPGGALPEELEQELRALLESILNDAGTVARVFALLQSNELAVRGPDGELVEKLTLAETGAFWVLVWGFGAYNGAGELDVSGAQADGARFTADVFAALPWIRPAVAHQLARHLLLLTTADGTPILDRRFLADLLAIARTRPDVAALRELLLGLAERLSELERLEILRFYLPADDPDRVIAEIKGFLGGDSEAHGIQMASMLFAAETDDQQRSRIAVAVLGGAKDPFAAAGFLAQHGDALRNDMLATYVMGNRPDAGPALDAEYEFLLGAGADARARETLVWAMRKTAPEQLLELARNEPEDVVSAAALYRATVGRDEDPSDDSLVLLQELGVRRDKMTTLSLIVTARSLARDFRRIGKEPQASEAMRFLETVVRDPKTTDYYRGQALEALQQLLPKAEYEALITEASAGG